MPAIGGCNFCSSCHWLMPIFIIFDAVLLRPTMPWSYTSVLSKAKECVQSNTKAVFLPPFWAHYSASKMMLKERLRAAYNDMHTNASCLQFHNFMSMPFHCHFCICICQTTYWSSIFFWNVNCAGKNKNSLQSRCWTSKLQNSRCNTSARLLFTLTFPYNKARRGL